MNASHFNSIERIRFVSDDFSQPIRIGSETERQYMLDSNIIQQTKFKYVDWAK